MLRLLFDMQATRFNKCLEPRMQCKNKAIRAHSVQNSKILELLAEDGQVVALRRKMIAGRGLQLSFGTVGRNQATTFEGLCKKHDQEMFRDIDNQTIDAANEKQLFLLAYRAVIREQHTQIQEAFKAQKAYVRRVKLGLDPGDRPSDFGLHATSLISNSYDTYLYRHQYDLALFKSDFSSMRHDVVELDVSSPTIACSSLFSIDNMQNKKGDVVRACLNIIPLLPQRTLAVFSYQSWDALKARKHLSRVLDSHSHEQKYEVSKLLLNHCENFVLSPPFFKGWTDQKEDAILRYYIATIHHNHFEYDHPDLQLFD
jgi:hypothetical protein